MAQELKAGDTVQLKGGGNCYNLDSIEGGDAILSWYDEAGKRCRQEIKAADIEVFQAPVLDNTPISVPAAAEPESAPTESAQPAAEAPAAEAPAAEAPAAEAPAAEAAQEPTPE